VNADPPAYRYEINDLKDRCREKLLDFFIALRREIEDEDFLTRHWMEKTDKGTTHRKGIPQGAPISPANIYLHEADLWIERKMQERKMKYEIKNMLWECEIRGRGVRSQTTAGASSSDS
jgi:retron-type reverse transcriptase